MVKNLLITGGSGLVGSHCKQLATQRLGTYNVNVSYSNRYNLCDPFSTQKQFYEAAPEYVIHTAGRVGGIKRNIEQPYTQFLTNMLINLK